MSSIINYSFLPEAFIFVFGLFIGSFLNILVDRIPRKETVLKGRSHCEKCKKELGFFDLIPVVSFLAFKGKCRYCSTKLSIFYPVIEIFTGIIFVLTFYFILSEFRIYDLKFMISLFYYLFIISSFIVILFTDLKYGIIPDRIVFPAAFLTIFWLVVNRQSLIFNHLLSATGAFLFFVVISSVFYFITKKQGMGGGDIKLSLLLGLFLGFPNIVVCFYIAFLTGAFISIILILWKKKSSLKETLPFGPFLILGTIISFFWGNLIYSFASSLFGI